MLLMAFSAALCIQVRRVAYVVRVIADQIVRAYIAHIVRAEQSRRPQLLLEADVHLQRARSLVGGRQQALLAVKGLSQEAGIRRA